MNYELDTSLYLVTDQNAGEGRSFEEVVEKAIRGGCTLVQLREKTADSGDFYKRAVRIKELTDFYHIPLIINDRVDIMLAVGAAGVHVGQSDIPASVVRQIIGPDKILGVSAGTIEEAMRAEDEGADYLGVGAIFPTATKKDAERVSLDTLRKICSSVHIPVVAIGGINEKDISAFNGTGISGVAVVSALMQAKDPEGAARKLKEDTYGIL